MVKQAPDRMLLLSLLEASQTSVKSSELALRSAEEALTAAQAAHTQALETLRVVTEAFQREDKRLETSSCEEHPGESEENDRRRTSVMECESDQDSDDGDNFLMLSTNKNPINNIEDDTTEDEDSISSPIQSQRFDDAKTFLLFCDTKMDTLSAKL